MRSIRSISLILLALLAASPLHAQTLCADPGRDGNQLTLSGIVNTYYPATEPGSVNETGITLGAARGAATPIAIGDLLLAIQMQDGTIDSNNNDGYGDNTDGDGTARGTTASAVGQYEFVRAASAVPITGGTLTLVGAGSTGGLLNAYAQGVRATTRGRQTWQFIRVPQYRNATLAGTITAPYWNGDTGGVVVIDSVGKVNLNGNSIDVSGRGFRGGGARQLAGGAGADTDYRTLATNAANGSKGEGIAGTPRYVFNQETSAVVDFTGGDEGYNNGSFARGAPGNAGGGGTDGNTATNEENSGGGGGGNGGIGGLGGNTWQSNENRGGFGGAAFATAFTRVVMGGGGGAGTRNNSAGVTSSGGAGGGIVIIRAGYFQGPGNILANGATGPAPDNDGGGGGGAGGSIVLKSDPATTFNVLAAINLRANGGAGADTWITEAPGGTPGARHGPGGGGAGGVIWTGSNMTTFAAKQVNGGATGRTTTALDPYGANGGAGFVGTSTFTGQLPGVNPGYECVTTPVTLAFAESGAAAAGAQLRWVTATETDNVAFRIYEGNAERRRIVDLRPVASMRTSTGEPSDYSLALRAAPLDGQWWLGDVDAQGQERVSGPFAYGQRYGADPKPERIDWTAVRAKLAPTAGKATTVELAARLLVADTGFQRVTFEELLAAGVDLSGVPAAELAVALRGQPVARRVTGPATFGPGSAVEFFGEPAHELYGERASFVLERNAALVRDITTFDADAGAPVATWAWEDARYAPDRQYNIGSPTNDPWYAERLLAYPGAPAAFATTLQADAVALVPGLYSIASADLVGVTQWPGDVPDHRVVLSLDGVASPVSTADGLSAWTATLATNALRDGGHELRVVATGDAGFDFDLTYLDAFTLHYPRLPVARAGRWFARDLATQPVPANAVLGTLPGATPAVGELLTDGFEDVAVQRGDTSIVVRGLDAGDVVAYRRGAGEWQLVRDVRVIAEAGTFTAYVAAPLVVRGDWWVSTRAALHRPAIAPLAPATDILAGAATWLVITVPEFHDALAPLVARRSAQGLATDVVDVAQVYRRYSGGTPDPAAITQYLRDSAALRGTRYVLLAGGDTYDYDNHLGIGSVSFVPTRYAATSNSIRYAPADGLLADFDGDELADLPIGRLPARSAAELEAIVAKLLAYEAGGPRDALFTAGAAEAGGSFRTGSEEFATLLPGAWTVSRAYVDDLGVAGARTTLLDGFGRGPGVVSFFGHSAPGQWTFDPIFTSADVASLANVGKPSLVLQWGCWNSYFVAPAANTLAHALLLTPSRGAVAAFGSTALTEVASHSALGAALYPKLLTGARLGDAVLAAQRAVAAEGPARRDAWVGSALLGDPAMPLR